MLIVRCFCRNSLQEGGDDWYQEGQVRKGSACTVLELGLEMRSGTSNASTTTMDSPLPPGIYWPASGGSREIVRKRLSYGTRGTGVLFGLVGALAEQPRVVLLCVRKTIIISNQMKYNSL